MLDWTIDVTASLIVVLMLDIRKEVEIRAVCKVPYVDLGGMEA
jgi:hypothetical protein